MQKFMFDRHFAKVVFAIAIPLMLQQLITSSVSLVDNLMVGQLGDLALAAVFASNKFYLIGQFSLFGVTAATSIFVAQFYGARNEESIKQSFRCSIIFTLIISIIFSLITNFFPEQIITFFNDDIYIKAMALEYMSIMKYLFIPLGITLAIATSMRAIGDVRTPLFISAIAVLTNTVLNYCLIFGNLNFPELGIKGAALATFIARTVECTLLICMLVSKNYLFKSRIINLLKIDPKLMMTIINKAIPLCLNELLWSFGMATLFSLYSTRGIEAMAGYSIGNTISDMFFILFGGMGAAATILVSHHLGANELEQAKENGYKLIGFSVTIAMFFATLMFISSFIVPNFYNVSIESTDVATKILVVMSIFFLIYTSNTSCYFILRAGGDTKNTFLLDSGFMWGVNITFVSILAYTTDLSIIQLYICGQLTDIIKFILAYRLVSKENWVKNITHY